MSDEQLLKYIKRYPVLYNTTMSQYRDAATRNVAWEEISERMHVSVDDLKARWAKLRNCYTNAVKRRRKKTSHELRYSMPWKYENQMEFLLPYLSTRKKNGSMVDNTLIDSSIIDKTMNDNDNDSIKEETFLYYERPPSVASSHNGSVHSSDFKQLSPPGHNDSYIIKEFKEHNRVVDEMDEHDYFFMSMSKQFKKLPRSDQSDIKFQIHKLIYEAEKRQQAAYSMI